MSRASVLVAPAECTSVDDDDNTLVARARAGDERAFEVLFTRYRPPITSFVQRMVGDHGRAEDITQEVFISALRSMRTNERPIAFRPWLYKFARNACIDQYRRSRRAEELSFDADDSLGAADRGRLVAADPTPDERLAAKQRLEDLCGAFGDLSDSHHQILVLRELEGMSYREIGDRMGMSRPAVESTLFRARRRLTEEYDELITGRRCLRVQSAISAAEEGDAIAARDRRRLARHLSYCQPCRRYAHESGVEVDAPARPSVASRLGALLPIPFQLRARRSPEEVVLGSGAASSQGSTGLAQWSAALTTSAEPLGSGLAKFATAAATLAVATVGSGVGDGSESPLVGHGAMDRTRPAAAAVQMPRRGGDEALLRPAGGTFRGRFAQPAGAPAIARVTLPSPKTSASEARRNRERTGARDDERRDRDRGDDTPAPGASGGDSAGEAKRGAGTSQEGRRVSRVELPRTPASESVSAVSEAIDDAIDGTVTPVTAMPTEASVAPLEVTTPTVAPAAPATTATAPRPYVGAVSRTLASTPAAAQG